MLFPLVILAILSVVGGWIGVPAGPRRRTTTSSTSSIPSSPPRAHRENALNADQVSHGLELGLAAVSVLVALLGLLVAYLFYYRKPGTAAALAQLTPRLYTLVANKFYVDEIYRRVSSPACSPSRALILYGLVDRLVVDGAGKSPAGRPRDLGELTRRIQSGNIRSYAGWLALGAAAVIAVMIFGRHPLAPLTDIASSVVIPEGNLLLCTSPLSTQ